MGSKKSTAPEYKETTYDTGGLFGSSTNNASGTTYKPADWMTNTMGTVTNNINPTLSSMFSNDFSNDANFKGYQDQLNKTMEQNYDTSVLSNLANRGLMRSSGLQAATNSFNDTLTDNTMALYDNYYNRLSNNLANALNTSNTLYDYMTGLNSGALNNANAVNNYNLTKYKIDNSGSGSNIGSIIGGLGNIAGAGASAYKTYKGG
jgi:hypothetical protein